MIGQSIIQAKEYLLQDKVVAIPTETVYGLAGNMYATNVVQEIYRIKQRPPANPLIVHTNSLSRLEEIVASWPAMAKQLAAAFWPGPLTLVLPKKSAVPEIVTAGLPDVAVRIPRHPMVQGLLASLPFPLVAPSANPSGYISPTTAQHVAAQLAAQVPYILDGGACTLGLESTIVGFQEGIPIIYRLGSIPTEAIVQIVGEVTWYEKPKQSPTGPLPAPGNLWSHYAPHTPLILGDLTMLAARYKGQALGALSFTTPIATLPLTHQIILSPNGDIEEAAQQLFAALRYLDTLGCDLLIAPYFPAAGLGSTMNERLQRASYREVLSPIT